MTDPDVIEPAEALAAPEEEAVAAAEAVGSPSRSAAWPLGGLEVLGGDSGFGGDGLAFFCHHRRSIGPGGGASCGGKPCSTIAW